MEVSRVITKKIEDLKKELDQLIEFGASKEQILDMSVKIDKMLVEYYKENTLGEVSK